MCVVLPVMCRIPSQWDCHRMQSACGMLIWKNTTQTLRGEVLGRDHGTSHTRRTLTVCACLFTTVPADVGPSHTPRHWPHARVRPRAAVLRRTLAFDADLYARKARYCLCVMHCVARGKTRPSCIRTSHSGLPGVGI
jgi:hypothetical protein